MSEENTPDVTEEYVEEPIDSIVAEFADVLGFGAPPPEKQEPTPAKPAETQATEPDQAGAPAAEPEEVVNTNDVPVDPLATTSDKSQVIAERAEAEAARRDAAKQAEVEREQAIAQAKSEAAAEVYKQMRLNPQRWAAEAREQGIDPGELAMHMYRVALGDDAPPELVKRTQQGPEAIMSEVDRRFAEQEARLAERERQIELKAIANSYESFVNNVPESEKYLHAAAKNGSDKLKQNLYQIADAMANANEGKYPTVSELTAEYNRQVEEIVNLHKLQETSTESPATPSSPKSQQKSQPTLSENLSDRRSADPEQEDLSDEALEQSALEYLKQHPIEVF
jgi:hypothetical protein